MSKPTYKSIAYGVKNPVFSHVILLIVVIVGTLGIFNIRTQLIPNLTIPQVFTQFVWPGASAEQMETSIIDPAENQVDGITGLDTLTSVSRVGSATMVLAFFQNQNINTARQEVVQALDSTAFPSDMEDWRLNTVEAKEQVARILISDTSFSQLKANLKNIRLALSNIGIQSTTTIGEPNVELIMEVNPQWLRSQHIDLQTLSQATKNMLIERPSGFLGQKGQYTSTEVGITPEDIVSLNWSLQLPGQTTAHPASSIFTNAYMRPSEETSRLFQNNEPVAEIQVFRAKSQDLLSIAKNLQTWLGTYVLADGKLSIYDETWSYFYDRLMLLGKNGLVGLLLIAILLTYFLTPRTAFWVGMGLPIALLATIAVLFIMGLQINMISLFAMILSLGIIVDDAIVVAERHTTLFRWHTSAVAATHAASEMVKPIMTSSVTTLAAFFPLLFISGVSGQFLREIPIVVITVIVASLLECFYILPKHLSTNPPPSKKTRKPQIQFRYFRINYVLPMVKMALHQRPIIITAAIAFVLLTLTLISTGRIAFNFFPSFTSDRVLVEVDFTADATFEQKQDFLHDLEQYSLDTIKELDPSILRQSYVLMNERLAERFSPNPINNGVQIWLTDQDQRDISNQTLIEHLNKNPPRSNLVNQMTIDQPKGGPPSGIIQIEMTGDDQQIRLATDTLKTELGTYNGVYNIKDDTATTIPNYYFKLQDIMTFTGLDTKSLYTQVQSYLQEKKQLSINYLGDDIDVLIQLPENTRAQQSDLLGLPIVMPNGAQLPLEAITDVTISQQPQQLIRKNKNRTSTITAQVDSTLANIYDIQGQLQQTLYPVLEKDYGVTFSTGKVSQDQSRTISELKNGAIIGICCIFLILVWATSSFKVPLAILLTVPLSLTGGILGHWILGFDISLLSLFGFFGLVGVTVNDSIILTLHYQSLRKHSNKLIALKRASLDRFRAVILTSLTTIGGLLPLMFETSFQAQFLIPMAITIAFGLLFGTVWILLLLPAILSYID